MNETKSRQKLRRTYCEYSDSGFISKPRKNPETQTYDWDGIAVNHSPIKGKSVVATQPLPMNLMIPYGGHHIQDAKHADDMAKNHPSSSNFTHYIVVSTHDSNQVASSFLDGHSQFYPKDEYNNAWIGSLVNEPSVGELPNANLVWLDPKTVKCPKYPLMTRRTMNIFVQLNRNIDTGEEIMVDYGYSESDYENLNYESFKYPKKQKIALPTGKRERKPVNYVAMHTEMYKFPTY